VEDVAALREAGILIVLPVDEDLADVDTLIQASVLSLWGVEFSAVGQACEVLEVWKAVAAKVRGVAIPECGHLC